MVAPWRFPSERVLSEREDADVGRNPRIISNGLEEFVETFVVSEVHDVEAMEMISAARTQGLASETECGEGRRIVFEKIDDVIAEFLG